MYNLALCGWNLVCLVATMDDTNSHVILENSILIRLLLYIHQEDTTMVKCKQEPSRGLKT